MDISIALVIGLVTAFLVVTVGAVIFMIRANDNQKELAIVAVGKIYDLAKDPARDWLVEDAPALTERLKVAALDSERAWDDIPAQVLDRLVDRLAAKIRTGELQSIPKTDIEAASDA